MRATIATTLLAVALVALPAAAFAKRHAKAAAPVETAPAATAPAAAAPAVATPASAAPAVMAATPAAQPAAAATACKNPNGIGVSRVDEIDTTGGPGFGFQHYKIHDFLQDHEVVLTFDDGPLPARTKPILATLADHCTKALFFPVGKLAIGYPEVLREELKEGHTVGAHTFNHLDISKIPGDKGLEEIERGFSAVKRGAGQPTAPFFRYPFLRDSPDSLAHLGSRNIAIFSTDIDSFDFKPQTAEHLVTSLLGKLDKQGKGIILMHDIQPHTAQALPALLAGLKAKGFKIVQIKAKDAVKTLPEYDALIDKDAKGLSAPGGERPTSSVVKTIGGPQ